MDLIIRNAMLRNEIVLKDIGVKDGKILKISNKIEEKSNQEIDAKSRLCMPTFIDPHIHLDKCLISEVVRENKTGTLREAIEIIWNKKRNYAMEDIINRAMKVIKWSVCNGTTILRTHADVDTIGGILPVKALIELKNKVKDIADIQIVAFPQEGILQDEGTEELLNQSIELGADVIGGMPYNEMTPDDSKKHIDIIFEIAKKFNVDIDMHVDETDDPSARTLQYLCAKTIKEGYQGRVTACHTCALSAYDPYYRAKVIGLVKKANINMVTNPVTNLMLEGRLDVGNIRRGLTAVKELLASEVNVCYGQDCIKDTFYPTFGKADILEVGMIGAHAIQFSTPKDIEVLANMCTFNAAKMLRISNYGLKEGCDANFNILDVESVQEAFRLQPDRTVIRKGKIIAKRETKQEFFG